MLLLSSPDLAEAQNAGIPCKDLQGYSEGGSCYQNPAHLDTAFAYVGTQELGNNAGPEVKKFLASVGLPVGNPYCAAFVSFTLEACPLPIAEPTVRSALARAFKTDEAIKASMVLRGMRVEPGWILGWEKGNTIFGHLGEVKCWGAECAQFIDFINRTYDREYTVPEDNSCGITVEANTSSGVYGSQRDGDGVWVRYRCIEPGNYFRIKWFTPVQYEEATHK